MLTIAAITGIIALTGSYAALKLARRMGWFAQENSRTIHRLPTPQLGGAAVAAAFLMGTAAYGVYADRFSVFLIGLMVGFALMTAVGLIDDARGLAPWQKLAGQTAAAAVIAAAHGGVALPEPIARALPAFMETPLQYGLALFWIVGATNALNLIDGADGLASGAALAASAALAAAAAGVSNMGAEAFIAVLLFAAALGFLPFNLPPAKMFLGDAGALSIGCALGAIALKVCFQQTENMALYIFPLTALSLPIFDTAAAIVRRRGRWAEADKSHIHHRLFKLGWSPAKTAGSLALLSAVFAAAGAVAARLQSAPLALAAAAVSFGSWLFLYHAPSRQSRPAR